MTAEFYQKLQMSEESGTVLSAKRKELSTQILISSELSFQNAGYKTFSVESKITEFGTQRPTLQDYQKKIL